MDYKALRKKYGYSQDYVAKVLGITRITYDSREKGKTERKKKEYDKLINLYTSFYSDTADKVINDNAEMSVYQLEYVLEGLQDMGLLSEKGVLVRSNIWIRFIKGSKIFDDKYISVK